MRGRGREKLNWNRLFLIVWEDQMEAPGSFEEWEVCFPIACSVAASRCKVGPSRQLFSEDSSSYMDLSRSIHCKENSCGPWLRKPLTCGFLWVCARDSLFLVLLPWAFPVGCCWKCGISLDRPLSWPGLLCFSILYFGAWLSTDASDKWKNNRKTSHVNQTFCSVSWCCCNISLRRGNLTIWNSWEECSSDYEMNFVWENSWGFSYPWLSSWSVMLFIGIKCSDLFYFSRFFPRFGWQRVEKIIRFLDNSNAVCCVRHTSSDVW